MKRKLLLTLICAVLLLTGCTQQDKPAMYIEPVEAQPLRNESFHQTYDFRMDEGLKSVVLEVWELVDGQWTVLGGVSVQAPEKDSQFFLSFNDLPVGVTYAASGASFTYTINKDFAVDFDPTAGNIMYTTMLTQLQEIAYETPIPMAMQIYTANDDTQFIGVDFFHQPEKLAAEGHDHVFVATLTFSQTPME